MSQEERKYIRMQEVGIACWISIPLALILLAAVGAYYFGSICMTILVLATIGFCCLELGHEGRKQAHRPKK